jgi:hypothetical protein
MDQKANRRGMHRLGAPRPSLEWPEGRPAEGEERRRAEFARERLDRPPAPAVERMVGAVAGFVALGERAPAVASDHAGENDRVNIRERAAPLFVGEEEGAARSEASSRDGGENSLKPGAPHKGRLAGWSRPVIELAASWHISLDTNHLASSGLRAQNSTAADQGESGATSEASIGRSL